MEDAIEIEKKLRKVGKENNLSQEEMRQFIQVQFSIIYKVFDLIKYLSYRNL